MLGLGALAENFEKGGQGGASWRFLSPAVVFGSFPTAKRRARPALLEPAQPPHDFGDHRFQLVNLVAMHVETKRRQPLAFR